MIETDNSSALLESASKWMRARGWHELLGKQQQYTQSLFHHVLVQLNFLTAIRPLLCDGAGFGFTQEQFHTVFAGNLCHDVGKEDPAWQEAVRKGNKPPDHVYYEKTRKAVEEWAELLGLTNQRESFGTAVLAAVGLHHKATQGPANTLDQLLHSSQSDPRWRELADLVEATDKICSAGTVTEAAAEAEKRFGNGLPHPKFSVTFHRIQILRGVSTTFLHKACQDAHVKTGWTPVLHFADGTLYFALASDNGALPTVEDIRQTLGTLLDQLLQHANLPQQVVGDPRTDILPKPELFNPTDFETYLRAAGQRSKPVNFRKKHKSARDGKFSDDFLGSGNKEGMLPKYCRLKGISVPAEQNCHDRLFEQFVTAVPLDGMFRFFKAVVLGEKLIADTRWPLTPAQLTAIDEQVKKTKAAQGKEDDFKEKLAAKARREQLNRWHETLEEEYEQVFGRGAFDDLASVTNDPALNLAKAVDYFLEQEVPSENVKWASKPSDQQRDELISRLASIFKAAAEKLPVGVLPPPLDGKRLADIFSVDLMLPGISGSMNVTDHLAGYIAAKEEGDVTFCPWSNETGYKILGTGSDFGVATDGHSNRLPMQDKTWKNRGGVPMGLSSRYELMLRRLILGAPTKQLIVLIPPMQLGPFEGHRLVEAVSQLEQDIALYSREHSPDPARRFTFVRTWEPAQAIRHNEQAQLGLSRFFEYSDAKNADKYKSAMDKGLQDFFGPNDDGEELRDFNNRHGQGFKTWPDARKSKDFQDKAESEFLRLAITSFNQYCGTSFGTWEEMVEAIYSGKSEAAQIVLANCEEVRDQRKLALNLSEPGRFVCQTPNLIFVLLPEEVRLKRKDDPTKKESEANGAIRQLFLSLVFANALNVSVALFDAEEALTFTGGEGTVRIPRNAALRAKAGRVRRTWTALGKPVGCSPTHEWLLPHEITPWLHALAALHYLAGQRPDKQRKKMVTLFPDSSALYSVLSARSAGFLVKRIEDKTSRNVFQDEMKAIETLEQFLG
jgi:hypothetical protein